MQAAGGRVSPFEGQNTPLGPSLAEPTSLKYEGLHQKLSQKYNQNPSYAQPLNRLVQLPTPREIGRNSPRIDTSTQKRRNDGQFDLIEGRGGPDIRGISVARNVREKYNEMAKKHSKQNSLVQIAPSSDAALS